MASGEKQLSSCGLCDRSDDDDMVQCDVCDVWFHYECVNVDEQIANKDWMCSKCKKMQQPSNEVSRNNNDEFQSPIGAQDATLKVDASCLSICCSKSSSVGSCKTRQRIIKLKRLEEEQKLRLEFLQRKFEILADYDTDE